MTGEEKSSLADFLNTAYDYLRSGYRREREAFAFTDDAESAAFMEEELLYNQESAAGNSVFSSLPLAYQVDEDEAPDDDSLEKISADIKSCSACPLGKNRANAVPGEGVKSPLVMIVGEGPGADEDASGRPFVGKAGQLLDRMLASIGLYRDKNCFIANVVKCRPPENRDPLPEETEACAAHLDRQIRLLKPLVILCAGRIAARRILKSEESLNRLRGRFGEYLGIPVLPTYHPSALLRDETYKRPSWEDLKMLKARLVFSNEEYSAAMKDN